MRLVKFCVVASAKRYKTRGVSNNKIKNDKITLTTNYCAKINKNTKNFNK